MAEAQRCLRSIAPCEECDWSSSWKRCTESALRCMHLLLFTALVLKETVRMVYLFFCIMTPPIIWLVPSQRRKRRWEERNTRPLWRNLKNTLGISSCLTTGMTAKDTFWTVFARCVRIRQLMLQPGNGTGKCAPTALIETSHLAVGQEPGVMPNCYL